LLDYDGRIWRQFKVISVQETCIEERAGRTARLVEVVREEWRDQRRERRVDNERIREEIGKEGKSLSQSEDEKERERVRKTCW
jgi:hypothetical protein